MKIPELCTMKREWLTPSSFTAPDRFGIKRTYTAEVGELALHVSSLGVRYESSLNRAAQRFSTGLTGTAALTAGSLTILETSEPLDASLSLQIQSNNELATPETSIKHGCTLELDAISRELSVVCDIPTEDLQRIAQMIESGVLARLSVKLHFDYLFRATPTSDSFQRWCASATQLTAGISGEIGILEFATREVSLATTLN